ncbi:PAS domain S-box protein [Arenimonas donghaensis]|nr:PAS domain S-box protein [Arenimonas donghaensis]
MNGKAQRPASQMTSERLGQIVEDSSAETYLFSSTDFRFVLVNRGARENLGYSLEELEQLTPWDLKPSFKRETFLGLVAPLLEGRREVLSFETVHRRKDGSLYDVSVQLQLVRTDEEPLFFAAIRDVTEQKQTERDLKRVTARLDAILNNTTMSVFLMDDRQHCVFMNKAAEQMTGYTLAETQGRPLHDVIHHTYPDGRPFPLSECEIDRAFPDNYQTQGEEVFVHKDGSFYPVGFTASPMRDETGKIVGTVIEAREISEELKARGALNAFNEALQARVEQALEERRQIESQLLQSQKMEAVGQLTGGIAHDFNNLLQVIGGNLELLKRDIGTDERAQTCLNHALEGVERGAKLASQLLAFGRQQPLQPKPTHIGRLVRGMSDMLTRSLGERIEIETVVGAGLWNCLVDPVQVENAILNLAINGRDAMDGEGKLTIEAGNAFVDDRYAADNEDVRAGQYVMLAVTDTGRGMSPDLQKKVFDPFFTTKAPGQGTGLGLSMVYGFVKQTGGHVKLYSEEGQGTTVRLYLPRTRAEEAAPVPRALATLGGTETILVVEDEQTVRSTAVEMLGELGYKVLEAGNAEDAMAVINSGVAVDLLFTDVVMPGKLRSVELARLAREKQPGLNVLFTSGYTENAIVHSGRLDHDVELLSKPYSREQLADKVRRLLDSAVDGAQKPGQGAVSGQASLQHVTLLILEDEAIIRKALAQMAKDWVGRVLEAGSLAEAAAILTAESPDMLIADLTLPDGSAIELVNTLRRERPALRIIIASGADRDALIAEHAFDDSVQVLQKPYDQTMVKQCLLAACDP